MNGVFWGAEESEFLINILFCLVAGILIGLEREARGKAAGISTQSLVIGGSMLFTMISLIMDPSSPARIAAGIVTGIGFLGAGIILIQHEKKVVNLTTAASIWFSSSIGMAIGFKMYAIAMMAVIFAVVVPRIPSLGQEEKKANH